MKILITAGPTRERIDPVRFVSNRSSGRMGYAIACAARDAGHEVVLISGPVSLGAVDGVRMVYVESAADMAQEVRNFSPHADVIIMAAAVADYRPVTVFDEKMKKRPGNLVLEFERTEDILASLGKNKRKEQLLVGFAAESVNLEESALGKLQRKNLDWIAANFVADGFEKETNALVVFNRDGGRFVLPTEKKELLAAKLLSLVIDTPLA